MSTPLALFDVLLQVPDPRSRRGRRHPLRSILCLAVVAMLAGIKGYEGIAQFGREKGFAFAHLLGFTRGKTPTKSTFSVIFRAIDVAAFEAALARWIASQLPQDQELILSIDGKTARGSRHGEVPGQHLISAYCAEAEAVLGQLQVDAKTNEHKAALALLKILPVKGKIITGDAIFCQRDLCKETIDAEGDYVFFTKNNQESLAIDIQAGLAFQEQGRRQSAASPP